MLYGRFTEHPYHRITPKEFIENLGTTQEKLDFNIVYLEEKGFVEGEVLNGRIEVRFLPLPAYHMEIVEIEAARMTRGDFEDVISSHFLRFDENTVLRFNLTGGEKKGDYPNIDFQKLREKMPPILECQFAIQTKTRWIMK